MNFLKEFQPIIKGVGRIQQGHALHCPLCGSPCLDVLRVGTELDPTGDEITVCEGTSLVFERLGSGEGRSAVRIDFRAECGHYWCLILQQDRDGIYLYARPTEAPPVSAEDWKKINMERLDSVPRLR
jgi:hypothetical protein